MSEWNHTLIKKSYDLATRLQQYLHKLNLVKVVWCRVERNQQNGARYWLQPLCGQGDVCPLGWSLEGLVMAKERGSKQWRRSRQTTRAATVTRPVARNCRMILRAQPQQLLRIL
jgi:hypothetical protein